MMNIGIIGCGFIGSMLAKACEDIDDIRKVLLFDTIQSKCRQLASRIPKAHIKDDSMELIEQSDLVIEAASHEAVEHFGPIVLGKGKDLMVLSIGAFNDDALFIKLKELTKVHSSHLYLPSGAIAGIDGLKSANVANLDKVELKTIKSIPSLEGAEYIHRKGINLYELKEAEVIYEGSAREAVKQFPKNVNVAAAVSLAGIGFDKTSVKIIADPGATRNHHYLTVSGRFGSFTVKLKNFPAISNPKTSYLAGLSGIATLRNIVSGVWIGT